jgi:hypothetical protein
MCTYASISDPNKSSPWSSPLSIEPISSSIILSSTAEASLSDNGLLVGLKGGTESEGTGLFVGLASLLRLRSTYKVHFSETICVIVKNKNSSPIRLATHHYAMRSCKDAM